MWTDAADQVEECDDENNNVGRSATTLAVNNDLPDLTVARVTAPAEAFAGQTIPVQWTVTNAGRAAARNTAWRDDVYLSADDTLDGGDRRLANVLISGPLDAGASYPAQAQVTIPIVPAGTYYLLVKADDSGFVFEGANEGNNTGSAAIAVAVPDIDLRVTALEAPDEAVAGQEMPVTWTVTNAGSSRTFASQWTDYVLLSRDQILDPTDRVLGRRTGRSERRRKLHHVA